MYKIKNLKLDAIIADIGDPRSEVIPVALRMSAVSILRMPAGVSISLMFGQNANPIVIDSTIVPLAFDVGDDDGNKGLYWLNPVANAGLSIDVLVSISPPEEQPANRESVGPGARPGRPPFSH